MNDAISAWKRAAETGDADAASGALSESVELVSPLTDQFAFVGREAVTALVRDVLGVVTDFRFVRDSRVDGGAILMAEAIVDGVALTEAQFIDLDADGSIARITMFFRPLPASTRFMRLLGPRMARRQGKPGLARTLGVAGSILDGMAATGDARFVPLTRP